MGVSTVVLKGAFFYTGRHGSGSLYNSGHRATGNRWSDADSDTTGHTYCTRSPKRRAEPLASSSSPSSSSSSSSSTNLTVTCKDTVGWTSGDGDLNTPASSVFTCADYESKGWCVGGTYGPGSLGKWINAAAEAVHYY